MGERHERGRGEPGERGDGEPTARSPGAEPASESPEQIERTDRAVERSLTGTDGRSQDELVTAAALGRLRALAEEPLPGEVAGAQLARLREEVGQRRGHRPVAPVRGSRRRRVVPLLAAVLGLLLLGSGGAVAMSLDAGPDDALYGVKRASERAWVALPLGADRRAGVHLALADRRLAEAGTAPGHAERLVAEGVESVEAAADERPDEAIDRFAELLGEGPGALPSQASPVARAALHRNCVRIAEQHGLPSGPCGAEPAVAHPGRSAGQGGVGGPPEDVPRGWGPGGRPEGHEGPPPGTPGSDRRGDALDAEDD